METEYLSLGTIKQELFLSRMKFLHLLNFFILPKIN